MAERCYIDEEVLYNCRFKLECMQKKAAALRAILQYVDMDAMFEFGYPVDLFEGLSEIFWDFHTEMSSIEETLDPEKNKGIKVETIQANLSLERG